MPDADPTLVSLLVKATDADAEDVKGVLAEPWRFYRRAKLFKKNGELRQIRAPNDTLKAIQRALLDHLLRPLEDHPANYCRRGLSVIKNAERHVGQPYVAAFDLRDAFPSTRPYMVKTALLRAGFEEPVARVVTRVCTLAKQLPQGAPSSPALLSVVVRSMDSTLTKEADRQGIRYTRYMDDLFFSSGRRLRSFEAIIRSAVRDAGYLLADDKVRHWGPRSRATLAGIVLGTTLSPTPEFLNDVETILRRVEKGAIALGRHESAQLDGMIAWVRALDRSRGDKLRARFRANLNLH